MGNSAFIYTQFCACSLGSLTLYSTHCNSPLMDVRWSNKQPIQVKNEGPPKQKNSVCWNNNGHEKLSAKILKNERYKAILRSSMQSHLNLSATKPCEDWFWQWQLVAPSPLKPIYMTVLTCTCVTKHFENA